MSVREVFLEHVLVERDSDPVFRQEAMDAWKAVVKQRWEWTEGSQPALGSFVATVPGYTANVWIQKKLGGNSIASFDPSTDDITLNVDSSQWGKFMDRRDTGNLELLLRQSDGTLGTYFIHEFIHYLDTKRFKGKEDRRIATGEILRLQGVGPYINDFRELNAYYQQALAEFQILAKTISLNGTLKQRQALFVAQIGRNEAEFITKLKYTLTTKFWNFLTQDSKERLMKRAYQDFTNLSMVALV